jgi:opacity protein-like surface antigen
MSRRILVLAAVCTALASGAAVAAEALAPPDGAEPLDGRKNQRIERIHVEDNAAAIDELRVGGQTQEVKVKPKNGAPEYEIQPTDLARSRPADNRDGLGSATGQRVWNILHF